LPAPLENELLEEDLGRRLLWVAAYTLERSLALERYVADIGVSARRPVLGSSVLRAPTCRRLVYSMGHGFVRRDGSLGAAMRWSGGRDTLGVRPPCPGAATAVRCGRRRHSLEPPPPYAGARAAIALDHGRRTLQRPPPYAVDSTATYYRSRRHTL